MYQVRVYVYVNMLRMIIKLSKGAISVSFIYMWQSVAAKDIEPADQIFHDYYRDNPNTD